jgi:hypothetical protein
LQTNEPYVTSFILNFGASHLRMKSIVLVPFTLLPTPFASLPHSFDADLSHWILYFGSRLSYL